MPSIRPLDRDSPLLTPACAAAAVTLGHALQLGNGGLVPGAIVWLTWALVLGTVGVVAPRAVRTATMATWIEGALPWLLGAGVVWQLSHWMLRPPATRVPWDVGWVLPVSGAAVLSAVTLVAGAGARRAGLVLLVCLYSVCGAWMLSHSPPPAIDVYVFQRDGAAALLRGENPYGLTFPDIYGRASSFFYGPGISVNGRLQFGYLYPPLSLLLALPGHLFFGDYRYSQLGANALAGLLMATARPGRWSGAALFFYLFTPRSLFILEQGWSEPFVVLGLAAATFAACRRPRLLPWAFGLFLAVKQYLF
ncbi:MAG TPA: hypothetical protein VEY30_01740, partial [Myxococcaceae bacterium]|nr:hypothetical protein [Myxococcaceae bacterium]